MPRRAGVSAEDVAPKRVSHTADDALQSPIAGWRKRRAVGSQRRDQRRLHLEHDIGPSRGDQRQIARELQRVAETLVAVKENAAPAERLAALPGGHHPGPRAQTGAARGETALIVSRQPRS